MDSNIRMGGKVGKYREKTTREYMTVKWKRLREKEKNAGGKGEEKDEKCGSYSDTFSVCKDCFKKQLLTFLSRDFQGSHLLSESLL